MQSKQPSFPPPTSSNRQEWSTYWERCGQTWRTEPEISGARQQQLATWYDVPVNVEEGIYPFGTRRLSRADVEWLVAGHEGGRCPVLPGERKQRRGVDLRGANLSHVNLANLPLSGLVGGLATTSEREDSYEVRQAAALQLQGASLAHTHLEGAHLEGAHLEGAHFDHAFLDGAYFAGANLRNARFSEASLVGAWLESVHGERAQFWGTNMKWAQILSAHLEGCDLYEAHLEEAYLSEVHLEGSDLGEACLAGAHLHRVFFDATTDLLMVDFGDVKRGLTSFSAIRWERLDLDQIDWSALPMLGNEDEARRERSRDDVPKSLKERVQQYREAAKVTRYLARAFYAQGLDEESASFALRAKRLERTLFFLQGRYGAFVSAQCSEWFNAYGSRPARGIFWLITGVLLLLLSKRGSLLASTLLRTCVKRK